MSEGRAEISPIIQKRIQASPVVETPPQHVSFTSPPNVPIPEQISNNPESQQVAKLQVFLDRINIPSSNLPLVLQRQSEELIEGKNSEGMEMTDEEYRSRFGSFINGVKDAKELNLDPEQQKQLEEFRALIGSEEVQARQVVDAIKGYVNNPAAQISPSEREEANTVIEEIREETTKGDKADVQKVSEKFSKLSKILKIIGAIILSLLGLGIFRAIKSERQ